MKPKFRSIVSAFAPFLQTSFVFCASLCAFSAAQADQIWTGDGTDGLWATTANWSGGAPPEATEAAVFNSLSDSNLTIDTGEDRSIGGIALSNPSGPVVIINNVLTLGAGGINMSAATQDLTINSGVTAADAGKQTWSIANGRTLTLAGQPTKATVTASPIEVSTTGTAIFGTATTNLMIDTANNPFVTYGPNDWAGLNAGTVVASTYTNVDGTVVAGLQADLVNNITGNLTGVNSVFVDGLRFNEATPYDITVSNSGSSRTLTARGILVTANSGGGSIGGNLRNNGFLRPNRTSGEPSFNIIQNSASDFTIGAILSNASSNFGVRLVKSGPGKLISLQNNSYSAGTFIGSGALQFGDGSVVSGFAGFGFPGGGDIVNHGELIINRASDVTLVNNISGTGALTQMGPGTLDLTTSESTFTGPVNINGGALGVTSLANLGEGTEININGATFRFLGVFDPSARTINIGSLGATFDSNGNNLTLTGSFAAGSAGSLTKTGTGTLALNADNDYSGGTVINAGTLLANAPVSSTGSGAITVNAGGSLGGEGKAAGAVTVMAGGNVAPGASVGTLTVGSLDLQAGSTLRYEFNNTPDNDRLAVVTSGGLTINGGSITLLAEGTSNPFAAAGTYNLISYSGSISGAGAGSLTVANPQPGFAYDFNAAGGFVTLTITTTGVISDWVTDGGGSWNTGTHWSSTVPNEPGATARFNFDLTAPAVVTLDGSKTLGALVFDSPANGYTLVPGSGGSITFNTGVAGDSLISYAAGTHEVSAPIILISSLETFGSDAAGRLTLSEVVSGSGDLIKSGPGSLSLLADNTFNGTLTLEQGATTFASGGLGDGPLVINNASLIWNAGNTDDISNRAITFGEDPVTFDTNGNDVTLANAFGNSGASPFTKAGDGVLALVGDAEFFSAVTISQGILQLGNGGVTGSLNGAILNNAGLAIFREGQVEFGNLVTGTGGLLMKGTGELRISNENTFTGSTTIEGGSITLLSSLGLQGSTLNYVDGGGTIGFDTLTAVTLGGLSGDKDLALNNTTPAGVVLTVGGNNENTDYSGVLSGDGSLVKTGTGLLVLSGVNTYTGFTTVNVGTLQIPFDASISTTDANVGAGSLLHVNGGTLNASGLSTINPGFNATLGLVIDNGGSATFTGLLRTGTGDGGHIRLNDGTLTAVDIELRRTQSFGNGANPAGAIGDNSLVIAGGTFSLSGTLNIGTSNSGSSTLFNGGESTLAGPVLVGNTTATQRWSVLEVREGVVTSTDAVNGIILGASTTSPSPGQLLISGGVTSTHRVGFGREGSAITTGLLTITGGELYVGAGGLEQVPGAFTSRIDAAAGVFAAFADWSTSIPMNLNDTSAVNPIVFKAADQLNQAFNITLNGALNGTGGLRKTGSGTLSLNGGHSYTGNTAVWDGTLSLATRTLDDLAEVLVEGDGILNLNFSGGDRIASLVLGSESFTAGIFGRVGTNIAGVTETPFITGNGLLYVNEAVPVTGYSSWTIANNLTDGLNDGPTDDPDFDGIDNLLEFVLGGDPLVSSTGILPQLTLPNANDFVFTFQRNDDSVGEATLVFEYGSDLSGWTEVPIGVGSNPPLVAIEANGGDPDDITITIPRSNGVNGRLFGRLKAVK